MDYRKPKRGWLYKTASLLVVSGCGHHPVSRRLEAAIGSAGSHVSFVTDAAPETAATPPPCCPWTHPLVRVLSEHWRLCCDHGPVELGGDQLLLTGPRRCRPCRIPSITGGQDRRGAPNSPVLLHT